MEDRSETKTDGIVLQISTGRNGHDGMSGQPGMPGQPGKTLTMPYVTQKTLRRATGVTVYYRSSNFIFQTIFYNIAF